MKNYTEVVEHCNECPAYSKGRDQLGSFCQEGADLSNAIWDKDGNIIIPADCPLETIPSMEN